MFCLINKTFTNKNLSVSQNKLLDAGSTPARSTRRDFFDGPSTIRYSWIFGGDMSENDHQIGPDWI